MTYDVLLDKVYEAYYDCRRRKRGKASALAFELDYEREVRELADDLWYGRYEVGRSIVFAVTRPKLREVFAADFRDRIVHHLIMNEFGGLLDREMIDDSFSCRVGKGVQYGVRRLREQIVEVSDNYRCEAYTLCCDISGFFMSIDKGICYGLIEDVLRREYRGGDLVWWLGLIRKVVTNRPELNCEVHGDKALLDALPDNKTLFRSNGRGLPIGNLTSQIFGNFYLTEFDKWSIAYLGEGSRYCRYVDDIRATSRDRRLLMRYMRDARVWLMEHLGLSLHLKKWSLQSVRKGVPFIGSVIVPWGVYAGNRLVDSAFAAVGRVDKVERYAVRMNSYYGFLSHGLTYGIRYRMWRAVPERMKAGLVCYGMRKVKVRNNFKSTRI